MCRVIPRHLTRVITVAVGGRLRRHRHCCYRHTALLPVPHTSVSITRWFNDVWQRPPIGHASSSNYIRVAISSRFLEMSKLHRTYYLMNNKRTLILDDEKRLDTSTGMFRRREIVVEENDSNGLWRYGQVRRLWQTNLSCFSEIYSC